VHLKDNKWRAEINKDGKKLHLGYFDNEDDAGRAYDKAARKYQKDFAELNFPRPQSRLKKWINSLISSNF